MRDRSIDFIKGISIIAIAYCHLAQVLDGLNEHLVAALQIGQLGCQVFFFFTGYLLYKKSQHEDVKSYQLRDSLSFVRGKLGGYFSLGI